MDRQIYIIYTARYIINAMRGKKDHSLDIVGLKILALWCRLGRLKSETFALASSLQDNVSLFTHQTSATRSHRNIKSIAICVFAA